MPMDLIPTDLIPITIMGIMTDFLDNEWPQTGHNPHNKGDGDEIFPPSAGTWHFLS